ncbi:MAG: family 20 glycosylhydrolase [Alistipes sp.]|nr:family 20 glycosylhydrolase [Alistipes sp.]
MKRVLFVIMVMAHVAVFAHEPIIIPTPQSVTMAEGCYTISPKTTIFSSNVELQPLVDYCVAEIGLTKSSKHGDIELIIDDYLEAEEYRLIVSEEGVVIRGGDYGGLFNGVMTLLQLLPANVYNGGLTGSAEVVCCEISDSPRYEHRGFMLDVCRTWMDKEAVMNFIDLLAYHKINSLRLHLTDDEAWRLEIKSHPELAEVGGFRGGDSPIWPRYGKWNEKWGGYYTQEDMREIIAYAAVRNIEIIPEIDLPGHSLCMATMHPEILCDYTRTNSASYGYDTRSAFCASREENYELLADILGEVCGLFPAEHIHIGGDEVDMSQWKRCPRCQALMRDNNMTNTAELQQYFMSRLTDILAQHDKKPAVWNEAIDGGKLSTDTRVYGWESIKECRTAAANYSTIVMPGQFFYFDMKQSAREPGHDWAAIFDWTKVYNFTLASQGFTEGEQANVLGFEGSFFSEAYASRNPETPDYLHYQTFPRIVALAEVAWVDSDKRDEAVFYAKMVEHYNRLDAMGVAYRLIPPKVVYEDGALSASTDDGSRVFYRREPMDVEMLYTTPIITDKPAEYCFVSRRGDACSPEAGVASHFKTITPAFNITSSMNESEKFSFDKAEGYGRIARTTRAGDVGDWVMFTFEQPVSCRRMKVATGNFQLPRYTFENGYVEVSYDGKTFERVGELDCGMFYIEYPARPIKAVRITCTSRGNGAEWVSIQPPIIWPKL